MRFLRVVFDRLRRFVRVLLQRGRVLVDDDRDESESAEVRRLRVEIEESLDRDLDWAVFEPNDERTWALLRELAERVVTPFWSSGRLKGEQAGEAFYVRCDRTTITQADLDAGRLVLVVGFAPLRPAEFVTIRIPHCFDC